ncbi:hypothetical protein ACP3T3_12045 [Chryseobacterium sp. CBSDS_008]|uniref:hypothetical protein n=1 Tax=Chryseobacterium sp. CBSDS_008 TaxID=3415265 RepID=UPI003CF64222
MNKIIEQANKILSYLSEIDLQKDIIELSESNFELISFLESIGTQTIEYQSKDMLISILPLEKSRKLNLWYRRNDGIWIIKLYEIKKILD